MACPDQNGNQPEEVPETSADSQEVQEVPMVPESPTMTPKAVLKEKAKAKPKADASKDLSLKPSAKTRLKLPRGSSITKPAQSSSWRKKPTMTIEEKKVPVPKIRPAPCDSLSPCEPPTPREFGPPPA